MEMKTTVQHHTKVLDIDRLRSHAVSKSLVMFYASMHIVFKVRTLFYQSLTLLNADWGYLTSLHESALNRRAVSSANVTTLPFGKVSKPITIRTDDSSWS